MFLAKQHGLAWTAVPFSHSPEAVDAYDDRVEPGGVGWLWADELKLSG